MSSKTNRLNKAFRRPPQLSPAIVRRREFEAYQQKFFLRASMIESFERHLAQRDQEAIAEKIAAHERTMVRIGWVVATLLTATLGVLAKRYGVF